MKRIFKILCMAAVCILVATMTAACGAKGPEFRYEQETVLKSIVTNPALAYPAARFVVFSDPHIFAHELGTEGAAFEEYLNNDRKMLKESQLIMQSLINNIAQERADFVLVSGDLTKDGELASHDLMAANLAKIEASGKQVYVVPGNHDILNPEAYSYSGQSKTRVANVTPERFAQIYGVFGYDEALYRDTNSLSYVAEPEPGLWLLALDACLYKLNVDTETTNGAFSAETLVWIEGMLIEAAQNGKAVIVMMHHNVMEHYKGQEKYFGMYIVDDYEAVGKLFAIYNVRMAFTGHYHAEDVTEKWWEKEGKYLYDIETGSLVTYPNPYRVVTITADQKIDIQSKNITAIAGYQTDFPAYSQAFGESGVINVAVKTLEDNHVSKTGAEIIGQYAGKAFMSHYAGDEKLPEGQAAISSEGAGFMGWIVVLMKQGLIKNLWKDLIPADNNLTIDLAAAK
jgi:UDP-2,3-diacylglucosamine pyrophosphatase LpxH